MDHTLRASFEDPGTFDVLRMSRGRSPKTLFQWSHGTSVSAGPDLDEPLVTDRPDFTEVSSTVGLGVLQLETGYTRVMDGSGVNATTIHSFPEALFRYGIFAEWLELRLQPNVISQRSAGRRTTGADDLYLACLIALTPQAGVLPELGLIPQMTLPVGASGVSANEVLPGMDLIYTWEINDDIELSGQTTFNRSIDEVTSGSYTEWATSCSISYTLTEKLGAYTE